MKKRKWNWNWNWNISKRANWFLIWFSFVFIVVPAVLTTYDWFFGNEYKENLEVEIVEEQNDYEVNLHIIQLVDSLTCFVYMHFDGTFYNNSNQNIILKDVQTQSVNNANTVSAGIYKEGKEMINFPITIDQNSFKKFKIVFPVKVRGKTRDTLLKNFREGIHTINITELRDLLYKNGVDLQNNQVTARTIGYGINVVNDYKFMSTFYTTLSKFEKEFSIYPIKEI